MRTDQHYLRANTTMETRLASTFARFMSYPVLRWITWFAVPVVAIVSFVAFSATTPPNIPPVVLSADPLYTATIKDKPTLALALSVEFPTVGAQYRGSNDYSNLNEYLGYYDAESCYTYNNKPTETPVSGQTTADLKRFERSGPATSRMCNTSYPNAFSGNFLNWASNSAIDMLRLALTGGDRSVDTSTLTLLQRAYLPNGGTNEAGCFFNNSSYFPAKQLKKSGGTANFYGAVPSFMQTAAGTNDIWIGNLLNQIYFRAGTSSTGSCTDQTGYALTAWRGTISSYGSQPSGWSTTPSYSRGTTFTLTGIQEVLYGNGTNWKSAPASGVITCNETTFTGGSSSSSAVCYTRTDTTGQTPPAYQPSDPYFYARVSVCNTDTSGTLLDVRDYGLCTKYPNGNYKPTGTIQKYSTQLRLAAFGYLMDQTNSGSSGRYGGVLRAPMKYVGSKTYDIYGNDNTPTGGNPNKEWDDSTGVFVTNPDSNSTIANASGSYLSGVITYLNQFGRTGAMLGRYKQYDPVGELHYEVLRYFQGLAPSADAISSITSTMYDGFPVYTTWTDPYGGGRSNTSDYSCIKSNIVVIGDVNTWDGNRLPTANAANNIPDINAWRTVVQNFEKNVTTATYADGQDVTRSISNPNGANNNVPSTTSRSQIMGSAYWARTHDIRGTGWTASPSMQRPGLRVKTFLFDVNENSASYDPADPTNTTKTNYRRYQNQFFMASKYGGFETDPSNTSKNPYNTWGNPFRQEDGTANNYVWQDTDTRASRVGEANTYFLQSDARSVLSAFDDIFSRASTAARSIAGGAIQSKNLTQAGDTIYQGSFDTADWSGDLLAIPVNVSATNVVSIGSTNTWTAATRLAALTAPATSRNIVVGNTGATANPVAVPFTWATPAGTAGIESSLRTALDKVSPTSAADGSAQDRLNYIRGDKSKEGNPFRKRNKLLGDIINSGVVYSGFPTTSIGFSTAYTSFFNANKNRTPAVFVGANDGMLHAFNATTGDELFAYIPSWLGPKLPALTDSNYANNHQSYADGTPAVAEAQVGSAGTAADWKTVLVSGTGGGGQGVFALDVTDPTQFSASKVMWEFTHADDQDMGHVVGRPQILKMRTSAATAATATYKWFAVVPSGVNNYVADGAGLFSATGNPALFFLDLSKPAGTAWTLGTNYYKVSLPVDSTLSTTKATGLINFRAALGVNLEVTQIFMGDLHGKLWKLDFSLAGAAADWSINTLSYFNKGTLASPIPYPMFIAKDSSGNIQPITVAPRIVTGPAPDTSYILFGTGKYLEASDKTSTTVQSFYMVYDNASASGDSSPVGNSAISGRARLQAGTVNTTTGVISVSPFKLGRATTDTPDGVNTRSGWYFDFPVSGERQITNATVIGDSLIFGSLIPGTASTSGSCSIAAGGGNQYTIEIASGKGKYIASSVGILGEPLVGQITGATTYTPSDSTGRRRKTITSQIIQQGSDGIGTTSTNQKTTTVITGRLSWRQINNYQDLKNSP